MPARDRARCDVSSDGVWPKRKARALRSAQPRTEKKGILTMSHHYSGPKFVFPRGDARLDYTDLFAFPKPGDPSKSILIMDVHPSFDVLQSGPTTAEPFAPEGLYEIKIDRSEERRVGKECRSRRSS